MSEIGISRSAQSSFIIYREVYLQSPFTMSSIAFDNTPVLQDITLDKGLLDDLKPVRASGDDLTIR